MTAMPPEAALCNRSADATGTVDQDSNENCSTEKQHTTLEHLMLEMIA